MESKQVSKVEIGDNWYFMHLKLLWGHTLKVEGENYPQNMKSPWSYSSHDEINPLSEVDTTSWINNKTNIILGQFLFI